MLQSAVSLNTNSAYILQDKRKDDLIRISGLKNLHFLLAEGLWNLIRYMRKNMSA